MPVNADYYKVLGIKPNATEAEIRKAYRALAKKYHPDSAGSDCGAEFRNLREAYEVLMSSHRREAYDNLRKQQEADKAAANKKAKEEKAAQAEAAASKKEEPSKSAPPVAQAKKKDHSAKIGWALIILIPVLANIFSGLATEHKTTGITPTKNAAASETLSPSTDTEIPKEKSALAEVTINKPIVEQIEKPSDDILLEGARLCSSQFPAQQEKFDIPSQLLGAISATESGRRNDTLRLNIPWPWTISIKGKKSFFFNKDDAIERTKQLQLSGIDNISVGCMQVNLKAHPNAFSDLNEAFEPSSNVAYAAYLLSINATAGDWVKAVGAYHSTSPSERNKYTAKVEENWNEIVARLAEVKAAEIEKEDMAAIENICSPKREYYGPAAYYTCRNTQLEMLKNSQKYFDLSNVLPADSEAIEKVCHPKKAFSGPASYYQCVGNQLAMLQNVPH
jgi:curved DNA-binding protein CbpA